MATEGTPAHTAIAAGKVAVLLISNRRHRLQVSVDGRPSRLQMSVNGLQFRLPAAVSSRRRLLPMSAAAARISRPVLRERASSLPGYHQLPLAVTGELAKPRCRAFVARPAVKAANKRGLPLPRQVEAEFLQAGTPPVTGNAGSKDGFASTNTNEVNIVTSWGRGKAVKNLNAFVLIPITRNTLN